MAGTVEQIVPQLDNLVSPAARTLTVGTGLDVGGKPRLPFVYGGPGCFLSALLSMFAFGLAAIGAVDS